MTQTIQRFTESRISDSINKNNPRAFEREDYFYLTLNIS